MSGKVFGHLEQLLLKIWYRKNYWYIIFLPFSGLFFALILIRKSLFKKLSKSLYQPPCPVIIVGNITVGGTGKTPFIIWLANYLTAKNLKVAILIRGYGGTIKGMPIEVSKNSDVDIVGDESIMIATKTNCVVMVHPDRNLSCEYLSKRKIDLIICDDGLQYYMLKRDYEIAIIDHKRLFGNGQLLPAGPLREPISRLKNVNLELSQIGIPSDKGNHENAYTNINTFYLNGDIAVNIDTGERKLLSEFMNNKVHAVAGIGNPARFFNLLERKKLSIEKHYFRDHQKYLLNDLSFNDDLDILMTEKDAVKCKKFKNGRLWYVPVDLMFDGNHQTWLIDIVNLVKKRETDD
ncbi:tetraacyldisaccharide 4'-kinase [Woeseiaceae bacterium]|nr:tetraacyldisaccharide 4'-kinase [Woeseiaceae bacterium]